MDFETGRHYVADPGNHRIDVFGSNGVPLFSFEGVTSPGAIAVDNGAASPSHHDIYVADGHQIKKFDATGAKLKEWGSQGFGPGQFESIVGIGVTAAGVVYVADLKEILTPACNSGFESKKRVQKFNEAGELIGTVEPPLAPCSQSSAFAVDSGGNFYIGNGGPTGALRKYDPTGTLLYEKEPGILEQALAVDEADDLAAVQGESPVNIPGAYRVISKYDPSGAYLRRYGYGAIINNSVGLAAHHSASSDACLSELTTLLAKCLTEPPAGPVIAPPSVVVKLPIGNTKATLNAEVNPEGKATSFKYEYVDDAAFKASEYATAKSTALTPLGGAADFRLHAANVQIGCANPVVEAGEGKCLQPETVYHFRIKATNADGSGNAPLEGPTFKTKPPLEIEATYATEAGTDSARLSAQVNPLGIPASGYFEYVDDAAYQADLAEGPGHDGFGEATRVPDLSGGAGELDFGSGEAGATRSVSLSLAPGTTYHYRVVVSDLLISPSQVIGPERTLTTFSKELTTTCAANEAFRSGPSGLLPDCRAYELVSPLDKENGDVVALRDLANKFPATIDRSAASGDRLAYGSSRAFGDAASAPYTSQYIASRNPELGWLSHGISPPRSHSVLDIAAGLEPELMALSPDLCESWWHTWSDPKLAPAGVDGFPNLYRGQDSECAGKSFEAITTVKPPHEIQFLEMETQGRSADGTKAIYAEKDNLTAEAPDLEGKGLALYYQAAGEGAPQYVCILPSGVAISEACVAGYTLDVGYGRSASLQGAMSEDGSRVYWTATSASNPGPGKIYLRENPGQPQSALSGEECTEADNACTVAVSKKGEELSGTVKSQFVAASASGTAAIFITGTDLYRFDVATKTTTPIAHKALGLVGASEDLSRLYLVSEEKLTGEPNGEGKSPTLGKSNLYLDREGTFHFVATLASGDGGDFNPQPRAHTARVSADGRQAVFMSTGSPTGYDNADAESGKADSEVYLYDSAANGGGGKLLCVSCNPSRARPVGQGGVAGRIPVQHYSLYATRILSEDGKRLYFESSDALSPRDTNGAIDVYQWEAPGSGGCEEGAPDYSAANAGCIDLISSGQSPRGSEIIDTSPSGDDVFFATLSSLLPQDYGLVDIYDARAGGGFPAPPPPPAQCEGEACQSPPEAPNDPTPASAAFEGAGNVVEPRPRCAKGKKLRKGRCVSTHHKHHKRAGHKRRAGR